MLFRKRTESQEAAPVLSDEEQIASYLKDSDFKDRLVEVGRHTADTRCQGGFAVYRDKAASFVVSQALLPDPSWPLYQPHVLRDLSPEDQYDLNPYRSIPDYMLTERPYTGVFSHKPRDEREATFQRQHWSYYSGPRKDLALLLHSQGRGNLTPSYNDIWRWSELEAKNPFIIGSTLTTSARGVTKLLMWRRKQSRAYVHPEVVMGDHNWDDDVLVDYYAHEFDRSRRNMSGFRGFAYETGLNVATASYNRWQNRLYPPAPDIAKQLAK